MAIRDFGPEPHLDRGKCTQPYKKKQGRKSYVQQHIGQKARPIPPATRLGAYYRHRLNSINFLSDVVNAALGIEPRAIIGVLLRL